jgi:hypothetical protein
MRECLGVSVLFVLVAVVAGPVWERLEAFEPAGDYRIPYELSEDYWLFDRFCRDAARQERTFVIGDSFVWGQFVGPDETLSHYLNRQAGSDRFVNAGLDGAHPLALEGLIGHHCSGLRNREVVLHLNLLWMSSPQTDLQVQRVVGLNHPRLVSQLFAGVPAYQAPVSDRIGVVLARFFPFLDWSRHIEAAYFSSADLPHWTLENPYLNPLSQITLTVPESLDRLRSGVQPWFVEGGRRQRIPWIELETSLQWGAFRRVVGSLMSRGNQVVVLVGPLNEHMLESSSLAEYREMLVQVEAWLRDRGLRYQVPPVLATDLYADMSHPLGQGYAQLARGLWAELSGSP